MGASEIGYEAMGHTIRPSQIDLAGPDLDPPKSAILSPPNEALPAAAGNASFPPKPKSAQMRPSRLVTVNNPSTLLGQQNLLSLT